jgi:hypothetical protein
MRRIATAILGLLIAYPLPAAQIVPGRWDRVEALPRGAVILVTLTSGDQTENSFVASDPEVLILTNSSGTEIRVAKADILRVARQLRDPVRNGVLVGTGAGFGAGFFALAAFNAKQTATGPLWEGEALAQYIGAGLVGAGIGALAGLAIDAGRRTTEIVYSRR